MKTPALTQEQFLALLRFRAQFGRTWKRALAELWATGLDEKHPDAALLRQLRNNFGPVWLSRFGFARVAHEYSCGCFELTAEKPRYYDHLCASCKTHAANSR